MSSKLWSVGGVKCFCDWLISSESGWESDARMDVGEGERDPPDHCDGEPDLPLQHYHTRTRVHHPHPLPWHTRLRCCPGTNRNRTWSMCFAIQGPFTNFQFFRRNNFFRALFSQLFDKKIMDMDTNVLWYVILCFVISTTSSIFTVVGICGHTGTLQ